MYKSSRWNAIVGPGICSKRSEGLQKCFVTLSVCVNLKLGGIRRSCNEKPVLQSARARFLDSSWNSFPILCRHLRPAVDPGARYVFLIEYSSHPFWTLG